MLVSKFLTLGHSSIPEGRLLNEEKEVESNKKDNTTTEAPLKDDKDIEKKLLVSAKIVERMVNLNTYDDIARNFRFYKTLQMSSRILRAVCCHSGLFVMNLKLILKQLS